MSFSKSATGTPDEIVDQSDKWLAEVMKADAGWNAPEPTKDGHGRQVNAGVAAVREFALGVPEDRLLTVSVSGHANADGTGNVSISIAERIAPPPAEGSTEAAAAAGSGG